jgi:hypothetical protein
MSAEKIPRAEVTVGRIKHLQVETGLSLSKYNPLVCMHAHQQPFHFSMHMW